MAEYGAKIAWQRNGEDECFIANSVKTEVRCVPVLR